jgi:hypothetical protein
MKNLRDLPKRQTIGNAADASPSEHLNSSDNGLKRSNQISACSTENETVADRIRKYCLYILLFVLTSHAVFGDIKNGYEKNIEASKESLKILRAKLLEDGSITVAQRRRLQSTIAILVNHVSYYQLTEGLLIQFKTIAPELYAEIDTITDRLGRPVNVYIRFVPIDGTDVKAEGTTYMDQSLSDQDTYVSEFGEFTVSVKVWIVPRALLVLAHELGHVKYQVPNLASYFAYHKTRYHDTSTPNSIGHDTGDPSGKSAMAFGKSFLKIYNDFLKISTARAQNPSVILARLKKDWSKNTYF